MRRVVLATGRPFNPRVFWGVVCLNVPAVFALIPFAGYLRKAYDDPGAEAFSGWGPLVADRVVVLALIAVLAGIGLALANRIGLGLPFVERWVEGASPQGRFRGVLAMGCLVGAGCAGLILLLDFRVFRAPMLSMFRELGIAAPKESVAPPFFGFLAAISAGITEETMFRLFGLSLLAWIGGLLFHTVDGRPTLGVLWAANILFALIFGAAHLADAHAIGWPMNALVLSRTFIPNGAAGLAFGWLFWTYGLESAILAHFFTDVGLYTLVPIVILREGPVAKSIAGAIVALVVLLGVAWAVRTLVRESRREVAEAEGGPNAR